MWKRLCFGDCVQEVKMAPKLQKKMYLSEGRFPVVAQESKLVNGYCNDKEMVFCVEKPLIVFGDHTQVLKYITFDFVAGADGIKLLQPVPDINAKFFYYSLYLKMPKSTGYARHYKLLKKLVFQVPPLAEQQRIVAKLDAMFAEIDKAVELTNDKLSGIDFVFKKCLSVAFKEMSENHQECEMNECYDIRDGTHDSPKYVAKGCPLVTSKNLKSGRLDLGNTKLISPEDYKKIIKRSRVDIGDVLMAMIGTIGNPIVVEHKPNYAIKNVALFKVNNSTHSSKYLQYYLQNSTDKMLSEAKGTTQRFVGLGYLRGFNIPHPPLNVQKKMSEHLMKIEYLTKEIQAILSIKLQNLSDLKSAILAQELQKEVA